IEEPRRDRHVLGRERRAEHVGEAEHADGGIVERLPVALGGALLLQRPHGREIARERVVSEGRRREQPKHVDGVLREIRRITARLRARSVGQAERERNDAGRDADEHGYGAEHTTSSRKALGRHRQCRKFTPIVNRRPSRSNKAALVPMPPVWPSVASNTEGATGGSLSSRFCTFAKSSRVPPRRSQE